MAQCNVSNDGGFEHDEESRSNPVPIVGLFMHYVYKVMPCVIHDSDTIENTKFNTLPENGRRARKHDYIKREQFKDPKWSSDGGIALSRGQSSSTLRHRRDGSETDSLDADTNPPVEVVPPTNTNRQDHLQSSLSWPGTQSTQVPPPHDTPRMDVPDSLGNDRSESFTSNVDSSAQSSDPAADPSVSQKTLDETREHPDQLRRKRSSNVGFVRQVSVIGDGGLPEAEIPIVFKKERSIQDQLKKPVLDPSKPLMQL